MDNPSYILPSGNAVYITGEGTPLVVLGGGPGLSSRIYRKYLVPDIPNHRVICWDYAATGNSSPREQLSFEADYRDFLFLIEAEKLKNFRIYAHSYGGLLALKLAYESPELIDAMALLSCFATSLPLLLELMERKATRWTPEEIDEIFAIMELLGEGALTPKEILRVTELEAKAQLYRADKEEQMQLMANTEFDVTVYQRNESWMELDFAPILPEIKVKTWIGVGKQDIIVPEKFSESLLAIPGSVKKVFENSGHWASYEEKPTFLRELSNFFGD